MSMPHYKVLATLELRIQQCRYKLRNWTMVLRYYRHTRTTIQREFIFCVEFTLYVSSESRTTAVVKSKEPCACGRVGRRLGGENIMTRTHYSLLCRFINIILWGGIAIFGTDDLGLYILPRSTAVHFRRRERRKGIYRHNNQPISYRYTPVIRMIPPMYGSYVK
jgi:hypothetical protein